MTTDYKTKYPIGSYWRTRGGDKVVVVAHGKDGSDWPVMVCSTSVNNAYWVSSEGRRNNPKYIHTDDEDLIAPWVDKKRGEVWVNVYDNGTSDAYWSKEDADIRSDIAPSRRIARVKVTWEEGQFDE